MIELDCMRLGVHGPQISRLGLGCWAIGGHGWGRVDEAESIRTVRYAFDQGVSFFDTADVYGLGNSEKLLAKALRNHCNDVVIATKGGVRWNDRREIWNDTSPAYLRKAIEGSLRRLKVDHISLYYIHKVDDCTPISDSMAALELLREEGKIGAIGVSNLSVPLLTEAIGVARISALQMRLNIFDRTALGDYLKLCKVNEITLVAWGALADGLLTGKFTSVTSFSEDDHRHRMPDFKGERFQRNLKCIKRLQQCADTRGVNLAELALRWVLDSAEVTASLFGAKTEKQVKQNLGASSWRLKVEEISTINKIVDEFRE